MKRTFLTALLFGAFAAGAFAQPTVAFSANASHGYITYSLDGAAINGKVPVGNPVATIGTYGQLNLAIYTATNGAPSPFTASASSADMPGLMPSWWKMSQNTLHEIFPAVGTTLTTTFNLDLSFPAGGTVECMVVGWTGNYSNWNTALEDNPGGLFAWTGSTLSGGAICWSQGTGDPSEEMVPVQIVTGSDGYAGLCFTPVEVPEPSTFALLSLGTTALCLFRRRR